ncbi:putative DEAD-box ATP-dependent RNA helicase [Rickettsiales bacterium Ac37b]|nr:putative DEAD-box ATP-dependent RNA helicase [Rickettsiales bacterium Ac37b]
MVSIITNFSEFHLPKVLLQSIERIKYNTPTPIQNKAIPFILKGQDVLASAQTGTGKTAAFIIPVIAKLTENPSSTTMVLAPTRELATQIIDFAKSLLGRNSHIKTALLIGGASIELQLKQLKAKPQLIIGTPGRVNHHLKEKSIVSSSITSLVLDEIDTMLDLGFGIQLEKIINFLPKTRQTLMFSATLPDNIVALAQKYLNKPVTVAVDTASKKSNGKIKQQVIYASEPEKYNHLVKEIRNRDGSIIVFVNTRFLAKKLLDKLKVDQLFAKAMHGDLKQRQRNQIIKSFRNESYRILIATNIAARGLDIPHVKHVINYDVPQCSDDYIHRIGRTGRAGNEGFAVSLVSPYDKSKWKAINRKIDIN